MAELTREYYYRIDDPTLRGLHTSLDSLARIDSLTFARGDVHYIGLKACKASAPGSAKPLEQVAQSLIGSVRVAVGDPDKTPTGGDFTLLVENTSSSSSVFTGSIAYNADGTAFQSAINAVVGSVFLLSVTATKSGTDYVITAPDANFSVSPSANNLTPECEVTVTKLRDGNSDVSAIWRVRVAQKGIAYAAPSTNYPTLATTCTATVVQAGSGTQEAIQTVTPSPVPFDGKCKWIFNQRQKTQITFTADVDGSLANKIVATLADNSGEVQIYLTDGTGTPPEAPGSGRQISVSYIDGDSAATLARRAYDQLNVDSNLAAISIDSATITVTSPVPGLGEGDAGFAISRTREARTITAVLPFNASESDIETALGGTWDVSIPTTGSWQLTALERGPQSLVNLDTTLLKVPSGVKGAFSFDTLCAQEAFAEASGNVTTTFGIEITQDGSPRMCVSIPTTVIRDNITTV